jgi:hypothetical protein
LKQYYLLAPISSLTLYREAREATLQRFKEMPKVPWYFLYNVVLGKQGTTSSTLLGMHTITALLNLWRVSARPKKKGLVSKTEQKRVTFFSLPKHYII